MQHNKLPQKEFIKLGVTNQFFEEPHRGESPDGDAGQEPIINPVMILAEILDYPGNENLKVRVAEAV